MTLSLVDLKPSELLDGVRAKVKARDVILLPAVSQKLQATEKPHKPSDGETLKPVTMADLFWVLRSGSPISIEALAAGLAIVLRGADTQGDTLIVSVYFPQSETQPLEIRDFGAVQETLLGLIATLSSEQQFALEEFTKHLKSAFPQISRMSFRAAVDSFIGEHPELLRNLAL